MDNYKLIRVIGRGAFGTAHLAKRMSDGKEVVIKQIPVEQMTVDDRQGALNEIKVLSMLQHPNVIEYFENFLQDKAMMIVMEYAAGGTLFELLQSKLKQGVLMEEEEVAFLFAQIVLPIYHVHQSQILHRDLKSENIFLTRSQDHVKIGDFGISKILSSKSKAFTVVGTPCYLSPELCEGKAYNTKSDIWALGCILYEMCACKRAFDAPTLPSLIIRIMRGATLPLPYHYSDGLKQLLLAMLQVDPDKRPSVPEIMSHHWLAPHIFRVHTTVGGIPCNAKPQRPLSVTRPDSVEIPEAQPRFGMRQRSPSPYLPKVPKTELIVFKKGAPPVRIFPMDSKSDITDVSVSCTHIVGLESSGAVLLWQENMLSSPYTQEYSIHEIMKHPAHLEGMMGINIVQVACGAGFICFLTDRGIVLTKGNGESGCLGHGDWLDVTTPTIIEKLLGYDVVQIEASEDQVAIVTRDYEVFQWGRVGSSKIVNSPEEVQEVEVEVERVRCGPRAILLITRDGKVLCRGENKNNRLFLDTKNKIVEKSYVFKYVLGSVGEVVDVSVSASHILVLTVSGEVWTSSVDGSRTARRVELAGHYKKIIRVKAADDMDVVVTQGGSVLYCPPLRWNEREQMDEQGGQLKPLASANVQSHSNIHFVLRYFQ